MENKEREEIIEALNIMSDVAREKLLQLAKKKKQYIRIAFLKFIWKWEKCSFATKLGIVVAITLGITSILITVLVGLLQIYMSLPH